MAKGNADAILKPGENCWRIERADKAAVIVDAAEYFKIVHAVVQQARRSVILIGWDFDTRISLAPEADDAEIPNLLGKYLEWVVEQNEDLQVYILKWDVGLLETLSRGSTPLMLANWMTNNRITMKLDSAHPASSAHHQKIVVIDDVLAFCGGIDITAGRWDTRSHPDTDPRRKRPTSSVLYGPWHDITTAVSGPAAKALGDLARDRWQTATGEKLKETEGAAPIWPANLEPLATNQPVAISRTAPAYKERTEVREIEALYLEMIKKADRTLYIESQYFASRPIALAMADRLAEADGPEIVVINPRTADGWLEEKVMGASRAKMLEIVRDADAHDRFRIYTPVAEEGTDIYVHAKVMILDDRMLKVGSSNLNNRSMGFDTEADLSIDASSTEDDGLRRRIIDLRNDLIAEHLDVTVSAFETALKDADGSLVRTIDRLRGAGRSLVPFEVPDLSEFEEDYLAETDILDPESVSASPLNDN